MQPIQQHVVNENVEVGLAEITCALVPQCIVPCTEWADQHPEYSLAFNPWVVRAATCRTSSTKAARSD